MSNQTEPVVPTIPDATWEQAYAVLDSGVWGDAISLRTKALRSLERDFEQMGEAGIHGITTSDINHTLYGAMKCTLSYGGSREDLLSYLEMD